MNKKKILSISVAAALLTSMFTGFSASAEQNYPDVTEEHWAYEWVNYIHDHGYIHGYPDGTYRPAQNITRAEFVTILKYILNSEGTSGKSFSDVNEEDWFYEVIHSAVAAGYLNGYEDGTMKPNNEITREEAAVVIAKAYGLELNSDVSKFADSDDISSWAVPYVGTLAANSILNGDAETSNFRPKDYLTRAEVASIIANADKVKGQGSQEEEASVVLPGAIVEKDGEYYIEGIKTSNIQDDNEFKVEITAEESGELGEYAINANLSGEAVTDASSLEELQNALNEKVFMPKDLENLEIVISGLTGAKAGASLNIKVVIKESDGTKIIAEKEYNISFGDADFKWPAAAQKVSDKVYKISGVETGYANNMIVSAEEISAEGVGDYTITAKNGSTIIADGFSLSELNEKLENTKFTAEELAKFDVTITAKSPINKAVLKIKLALADAETKAELSSKEYTIEYTVKTTSGTLSGGGSSGSGTTENPLEGRDRVVECLKYYCGDTDAASKIASDKADNSSLTDDMLMIILTNDGLGEFNESVSQTKNATAWKSVYAGLSLGQGTDTDLTLYNALKPVYEDVLAKILSNSELNYKANGATMSTATKKKYVGLFRGMVETINKCAEAAVEVYNKDDYADLTGKADEAYDEFINLAINNTASVLANVYTTYDITGDEKNEINNAAISYCNNLFNANTGDNENSALQTKLIAARADGLTIAEFAEILVDCIK